MWNRSACYTVFLPVLDDVDVLHYVGLKSMSIDFGLKLSCWMTDSSEIESSNPPLFCISATVSPTGDWLSVKTGPGAGEVHVASCRCDWVGLVCLERLCLVLPVWVSCRYCAVLQQSKCNGQLYGRGFRALAALFHQHGDDERSRLCIEAMA